MCNNICLQANHATVTSGRNTQISSRLGRRSTGKLRAYSSVWITARASSTVSRWTWTRCMIRRRAGRTSACLNWVTTMCLIGLGSISTASWSAAIMSASRLPVSYLIHLVHFTVSFQSGDARQALANKIYPYISNIVHTSFPLQFSYLFTHRTDFYWLRLFFWFLLHVVVFCLRVLGLISWLLDSFCTHVNSGHLSLCLSVCLSIYLIAYTHTHTSWYFAR